MPHDGVLELDLGDPGAGKDSYIFHQVHNLPFILVQQVPNNETMDAMPWVWDSDTGILKARRLMLPGIYRPDGFIDGDPSDPESHIYHFAVWSRKDEVKENPKIWGLMEDAPLLWLGDVNWWTRDWHRAQRFDSFVRNIRGRDQRVYASTHRGSADVQPFVYQYARIIKWIGPFAGTPTRLKELYDLKSAGLFSSLEEFEEKIRRLEKFNYADPNEDKSTLTIKDETI